MGGWQWWVSIATLASAVPVLFAAMLYLSKSLRSTFHAPKGLILTGQWSDGAEAFILDVYNESPVDVHAASAGVTRNHELPLLQFGRRLWFKNHEDPDRTFAPAQVLLGDAGLIASGARVRYTVADEMRAAIEAGLDGWATYLENDQILEIEVDRFVRKSRESRYKLKPFLRLEDGSIILGPKSTITALSGGCTITVPTCSKCGHYLYSHESKRRPLLLLRTRFRKCKECSCSEYRPPK